jgi:uncharacterized membrane protein YphA (DoxX/SURF4 family)
VGRQRLTGAHRIATEYPDPNTTFLVLVGRLVRHVPLRLSAGFFVLNAGIGKLGADDETAKRLQAMASGTYPSLGRMDPKAFARVLAVSEIVLGSVLLLPVVPSRLAGLGLTSFAAGLLGMYLKTPGMRHEGSVRPTQQGTPLAKDVWMLGIGLSLILDGESVRSRG